MRRIPGLVLVGLGTFLVVGALMVRFFVYPNLLVTPTDQFAQTIATGTGTVFDAGTLTSRENVELSAKRTVRGDVEASTRDVGVWDESLILSDAEGNMINTTTDRVAFDRTTGLSVKGYGESVNGEPAAHTGLSYKFPFGAEKKTYPYFDTTAKAAFPMAFKDTAKIQGLEVYRYEQTVPPTQIAETEVPGSLVGAPDTPSVTVPRFYTNTRTVWVEPFSGVIVKGAEQQKQTLRGPDGNDALTLVEAELIFNEATQKQQVGLAEDARSQGNLLGVVVPLVTLVLGVIALIAGLLMVMRAPSTSRRPMA